MTTEEDIHQPELTTGPEMTETVSTEQEETGVEECNVGLQDSEISQLRSESALLKSALVELFKLPNSATFETKRDAIGSEVYNLIRDHVSSTRQRKSREKPINKLKATRNPSAGAEDRATLLDKEEGVRQQLREAETEQEIQAAIGLAEDLKMSFEVCLGMKKLSKLSPITVSRIE
jgi:hypothetical protein